jgi:hypothetical protein
MRAPEADRRVQEWRKELADSRLAYRSSRPMERWPGLERFQRVPEVSGHYRCGRLKHEGDTGICWIFGHEDWVRRASGRLYLECLDCGRETPGWTTSPARGDGAVSAGPQAISAPLDRFAPDATLSTGRPGRARKQQHEIPIAA